MNVTMEKQPISAVCELLDETAQTQVECDILLPDYCPDIMRVLTCRTQPQVTDTAVNGSTLTAEGAVRITLSYIGEDSCVHTAEGKAPFAKSFSLPTGANSPIVFAEAQKQSLSCRAASRRRADVRMGINISVRVFDCAETKVITGAADKGICLHKKAVKSCCITERTAVPLGWMEEITPPAGFFPKEAVRTDCCIHLAEWKPAAGGVIVRGELAVSLLLTDSDGKLVSVQYNLPMSRLIEVSGGENVCAVRVFCTSVRCTMPDEEGGRMGLEAEALAELLMGREGEYLFADDAFSTECRVNIKTEALCGLYPSGEVSEKVTAAGVAPLPDGAGEVVDTFAAVGQLAVSNDGDGLVIKGRADLAALVRGGESGLQAVSASVPVECALNDCGEGDICLPSACVIACRGAVTEEGLALEADIAVSGVILRMSLAEVLTEAAPDESSPRKSDENVGMLLYYAAEGESVWDIARRYGVPPEVLMEENSLAEDIISERRVVLLPGAARL